MQRRDFLKFSAALGVASAIPLEPRRFCRRQTGFTHS